MVAKNGRRGGRQANTCGQPELRAELGRPHDTEQSKTLSRGLNFHPAHVQHMHLCHWLYVFTGQVKHFDVC